MKADQRSLRVHLRDSATLARVQIGRRLQNEGGFACSNPKQYRAKAAECAKLVKNSADAEENRKFEDLENRFVSLANNERELADAYHDAVHIGEEDRIQGAALAAEEERVLRCLGAAVIMQWNTYRRRCNERSSIQPDP